MTLRESFVLPQSRMDVVSRVFHYVQRDIGRQQKAQGVFAVVDACEWERVRASIQLQLVGMAG